MAGIFLYNFTNIYNTATFKNYIVLYINAKCRKEFAECQYHQLCLTIIWHRRKE